MYVKYQAIYKCRLCGEIFIDEAGVKDEKNLRKELMAYCTRQGNMFDCMDKTIHYGCNYLGSDCDYGIGDFCGYHIIEKDD